MHRTLSTATILLLLGTHPLCALSVKPVDHPSHFILLVDSSASPRATAARAALFRQTLDTALRHIYEDGFEGRIPRFDPQSDVMTIAHFGATTGEPSTAYERLDRVDFLREFIRVHTLREAHMPMERAAQLAWPDQYNRLTLLGWSRPLAVIAAAPREQAGLVARTFLVVVTDEIANDMDLSAELAMLRTRGKREHVEAAEAAIRNLREDYRIGDAQGNQEALWHYTMPNRSGRDIDAIELHEITSNELRAWSAQIAELTSAGTPAFQWTRSEDGQPSGTITFTPSDAFRTLVAAHAADRATLSISGRPAQSWRADEPLRITATFPRNISCQPPPLTLKISALATRADPLLGEVAFTVDTSVDVAVPTRPSCTAARRTLLAASAVAILLLMALIAWWVVYTRYRTHVVIDKPAGLVHWRLRWNKPEVIRDVVLRGDLAAFRVTLPPVPLRNLLYRNAVLLIRSNPPDQFQWNDSGSAALPICDSAAERAVVNWRRSRDRANAASLRIELHNRNRVASFEANPGMETMDV